MTNKSKNSDAHQEFKVPPAFKFQEGEKVLCFHGPLIYEAKCLQARYDDEEKTNKYHIHYSGWNKSWDEWVPESRVLKHNEGNIQRQKELHKAQKAEPKGKKGKKRSVTGKEKETDGKEKDADDSRSSTPVNEKGGGGGGGGKASASATQSSSQESASDIPKRKRSKLDPSVETSEPSVSDKKSPSDKKDLVKTSSSWKVNLAKPTRNTKKQPSEGSQRRSSPDKNVAAISSDKMASPNKKMSPAKKRVDNEKLPRKSMSHGEKSAQKKESSEKLASVSDKKTPPDKKDLVKTTSSWKVNLAKPTRNTKKQPSEGSQRRSSPDKNVAAISSDKKASPNKKMSPAKKRVDNENQEKPRRKSMSHGEKSSQKKESSEKLASPAKKLSPKKATSPPKKPVSPKKPLSPSKLYPVLKGRKLLVKLRKLDLKSIDDDTRKSKKSIDDDTGKLKPSIVNGGIDDLTMFGAYVVDQLRQISDQSKVTAMKIKIQELLTQQNLISDQSKVTAMKIKIQELLTQQKLKSKK